MAEWPSWETVPSTKEEVLAPLFRVLIIVDLPLTFYILQKRKEKERLKYIDYMNNFEFLFIWTLTIDRNKTINGFGPNYNLSKESQSSLS